MNAQPLTTSHESFHNRLARIEHRHSKQGAARRASSRVRRRSSTRTPIPMRAATVPRTPREAKLPSLGVISYLRCWSFGFLMGGLLTLAKVAVLSPEAHSRHFGLSSEALYAGLVAAYLFFFTISLIGIAGLRRGPMVAQFSFALLGTMVLGLI